MDSFFHHYKMNYVISYKTHSGFQSSGMEMEKNKKLEHKTSFKHLKLLPLQLQLTTVT